MVIMKNFLIFLALSILYSQDVNLQITNLDSTNGEYNIEISITSMDNIAGFQFQVTGGVLSGSYGGISNEHLSTITTNANGMVLAFDFTGNVIPPSMDEILINLTFSQLISTEICIENPVFTSPTSLEYSVNNVECISNGQINMSPSVLILAPQNNTTIYSNNVEISLLISDPNNIGYHYQLNLNDIDIGMFYENYFILENLPWGLNTLSVYLIDGNNIVCQEITCSQSISFTLEEPSPESIELSVMNINPIDRSFDIVTNSSAELSSFHISINGVLPIEIESGLLDANNFEYNLSGNTINGETFGDSFPSGENLLMKVYYTNPENSEICVQNSSFFDNNNIQMNLITNCGSIILPENQYFTPNLNHTGISQLIYFNSDIDGLEPGDEIGIFDLNGIPEGDTNCDNIEEGEILVGSGVMLYDELTINSIGSLNTCSFGGFITPGFIVGNPITIKIYRTSTMMEYQADLITFANGSGTFSELYAEITALTLINEEINNPPIANISENQINTYRNTTFTLDSGDSYDTDGTITATNWFLNGEELIGSSSLLTHQLTALGEYTITLVVTDNEGAIGSNTSFINVNNYLPSEPSLISPTNFEIIYVEDYENDFITFTWSESVDLDNDNLNYSINIWETDSTNAQYNTFILNDTLINVNLNSDFLNLELGSDKNYNWNVIVSDEFDQVISTVYQFQISFNSESIGIIKDDNFYLNQNYPNPFNPSTEIKFSLNKPQWISLNIYDLNGKHITQLFEGLQKAGTHKIRWNINDENELNIPSGLYIYELNSNSNGSIKKIMTLLK